MSSPMLVVGSLAFDTLHMPSGFFPRVLGGSATFAALAGSHFTRVRLVGVVGSDFPSSATELFTKRGIDLAGLERADGETFHWEGRYSPDLTSRESLATHLNVFASFRPKIPTSFRGSPFVMLGNIQPDLQREVLDQIDAPRLSVLDTMNFWITGARDALLRTLKRVDVLVLNDEEARLLAGEHNMVKCAAGLLRMGPRAVVVKKGEHGALLFEGSDVFSAPAYPTGEVVDPTGAGDTFAGALVGYCAMRDSVANTTLRRAIVYGAAVASHAVEGIGTARLASLTRPEIDERVDRFGRLVHFADDAEVRAV